MKVAPKVMRSPYVTFQWRRNERNQQKFDIDGKSLTDPPPKKKAPAAFGETPKESFLFCQSAIFFFCSLEYLIQSNRLSTKKKKKNVVYRVLLSKL